jgi:hypothetical protein
MKEGEGEMYHSGDERLESTLIRIKSERKKMNDVKREIPYTLLIRSSGQAILEDVLPRLRECLSSSLKASVVFHEVQIPIETCVMKTISLYLQTLLISSDEFLSAQHSTAQHSTAQHNAAQYSTMQHNTT